MGRLIHHLVMQYNIYARMILNYVFQYDHVRCISIYIYIHRPYNVPALRRGNASARVRLLYTLRFPPLAVMECAPRGHDNTENDVFKIKVRILL